MNTDMAIKKIDDNKFKIDIHPSDGTRVRKVFNGSYSDAEELHRILEAKLKRRKTIKTIKTYDLWIRYKDFLISHRSKRYFDEVNRCFEKDVMPFFGNLQPDYINSELIYSYQKKRLERGPHNRMINLELRYLSAMVNWGFREMLCNKMVEYEGLPQGKRLPKAIDASICKAIINAMEPFWRAFYTLMYFSGMRCNEVRHLKRADVDLLQGFIVIIGKGDKQRNIAIGLTAKKRLSQQMIEFNHDLVFPGKTGKPVVDVRKPIIRALKKLKLNIHLTPHMLRHSFGSEALRRGGSIRAVQEQMGHSSITTTQIYTHVQPKDLTELVRGME